MDRNLPGDVSRFASGQKINAVFARKSHILEVENDAATLGLRTNERFQLGDMLFVEPAAELKDHFPVRLTSEFLTFCP